MQYNQFQYSINILFKSNIFKIQNLKYTIKAQRNGEMEQ